MSLISHVIHFDDKDTRQGRRERDKLSAIRDVSDKWVQRLHFLYNPGHHITVEECLVPLCGFFPFTLNIPSKPAKYDIENGLHVKPSPAMLVYTGKSHGEAPKKIRA